MHDILRTIGRELRRIWPLLALFLITALLFGDWVQLEIKLYELSMVAVVILAAHLIRKALFPYIDLAACAARAGETSTGAALVFAAVIGLMIAVIMASTAHGQIPAPAYQYQPLLQEAIDTHWPAMPLREIEPAKIEQESGWNVKATLKTSREHGIGLSQITITERYDNFKTARTMAALKGWTWADRYNPKYHLIYSVITDRANYMQATKLFPADIDRWAGALVAYNAGMGTVLQRRARAIATGMPSDRWFGGLDRVMLPYEKTLLYGKPLGLRRNDYPRLVITVRAQKYKGFV